VPRPVSWLPRLHEIRRSVANSVRSHYARKDLELLFELQPRAAQKLLGMLPTVQVGTSRLVEREALHAFLDRIHEAEDTSSVISAARVEKQEVSRRKLRSLVQYDHTPVSFSSLPANVTLERGRCEVRFTTVEELAEAMYFIARVLDGEGEEFAKEYESEPADSATRDADAAWLDEEIQCLNRNGF
jgi:hypothetical protein